MARANMIFLIFLLCAGAVLCALAAIFYPRVSKNYPLDQRLLSLSRPRARTRAMKIEMRSKRWIEDA